MRKILWLTSVVILILSSCATTAIETVEKEPAVKVEETVIEETVKTVIVDIYLVSSEISSASDGIIDGYIEYKYDSAGNLLEKKEFDSERKQINRMMNSVSGNLIVKTQWFSGETDEPGLYILSDYSGGNLVKETSYDIKEIPQSISLYEYDNKNNVIKWTVSSGDNVPMMVTEYEYANGLKSKASFLTPLGAIEGYIEYSWMDDNIESEITYDEDGNLEKSIIFEYENGNLVKETYNKKTVIDHTVEYELDDNGNAAVKKHYYRSGNLKAQWTFEYISVKKEVQQ